MGFDTPLYSTVVMRGIVTSGKRQSFRLLPSAKSTSLCTREALNRSYPAKISALMTPSAATRRFISVSMLSLIPAVSALMVIVAQPLTGML